MEMAVNNDVFIKQSLQKSQDLEKDLRNSY